MAKTVKYYFGVSSYNTPFVTIPISKGEYTKLTKKYEKLIVENNEENEEFSEFRIDKYEDVNRNDANHTTEYKFEVQDGATYISLIKVVCDEGYHFR